MLFFRRVFIAVGAFNLVIATILYGKSDENIFKAIFWVVFAIAMFTLANYLKPISSASVQANHHCKCKSRHDEVE